MPEHTQEPVTGEHAHEQAGSTTGSESGEVAPDDLRTRCYYCDLPLAYREKVVQARTRNAWAHVTCWYDGGPFEREMRVRASA